MTAAGIPGMGYTDTSVAAKLSLDVPSDSVDILRNIALYSGEVQSNMEAAARFGSDFMQYLQLMPTIQREVLNAQKDMLQVLRDSASAMDALKSSSYGYGAGGMPQMMGAANNQGADRYNTVRSIPQQVNPSQTSPTQPQGAMAGMTDQERTALIQAGGTPNNPYNIQAAAIGNGGAGHRRVYIPGMGYTGGNSQDDMTEGSRTQHEDRLREQERQRAVRDDATGSRRSADLARIASGARRRAAMGLPPEEPEGGAAGRTEPDEGATGESDRTRAAAGGSHEGHGGGWHGILQNVIGGINTGSQALGPDGTPIAGRAALAGRLLGGVAGGIKSLPMAAKVVGAAGLGVGAAGLAFNAVQNIGEEVQNYRNMDVHGHTLGGGMQVQKDVMLMSLNPLISSEQSREIIMGAMNTGKTGGAYDSAVDFIKGNLVNMNMEVGKSVELLTNNVEMGRESISKVKFDLAELAGVAKDGGKTTEQVASQYSDFSKFLVGTSGSTAGNAGAAATQLTANFSAKEADGSANPLAEGTSHLFTGILSSQAFKSQLTQFIPGSNPNNIIARLTNQSPTALNDATRKLMEKYAKEAQSTSSDKETQQLRFFQRTTGMNLGMDQGTSNQFFDQLVEGMEPGHKNYTEEASEAVEKANTNTVTKKDGSVSKASDLQTSTAWLKSNPGKTQQDYEKAMGFDVTQTGGGGSGGGSAGKGGGGGSGSRLKPAANGKGVDASAIQNLIKSGENLLALDPDGGEHYLDAGDRDQVIGLSNGTWRLQRTSLDTTGSKGPIRNSNGVIYGAQAIDPKTPGLLTGPRVTLESYGSGIDSTTIDQGAPGSVPVGAESGGSTPEGNVTTTNNSDGTTTIDSGQKSGDGSPIVIQIVPSPGMTTYFNAQGIGPGQTAQTLGGTQANSGYGNQTRNGLAPGTNPSVQIPRR